MGTRVELWTICIVVAWATNNTLPLPLTEYAAPKSKSTASTLLLLYLLKSLTFTKLTTVLQTILWTDHLHHKVSNTNTFQDTEIWTYHRGGFVSGQWYTLDTKSDFSAYLLYHRRTAIICLCFTGVPKESEACRNHEWDLKPQWRVCEFWHNSSHSCFFGCFLVINIVRPHITKVLRRILTNSFRAVSF